MRHRTNLSCVMRHYLRHYFSAIMLLVGGMLSGMLNGCEILETSDTKNVLFQIRITTTGVPAALLPNDSWIVRYTINDSAKEVRALSFAGGTFFLAEVPTPVSARTGRVLATRYPDIRNITVALGNRMMYQANLRNTPWLWQDWTFTNTANNNRSASEIAYTLELDLTTFAALFIVENRDTTASYRFRFGSEERKDTTLTIPRGYAARLVQRQQVIDFGINLRDRSFSQERFFQKYMRSEIERGGQFRTIPFYDWNIQKRTNATEWYIRHPIYR